MGVKSGETIKTVAWIGATGKTVSYTIIKPDDTVADTGTMTENPNKAKEYVKEWTPTAVKGAWRFVVECAAVNFEAEFIYHVDMGQEEDIKTAVAACALEATLTAIKGGGWSTETLKAIYDLVNALNDITAASVWAVGTRTLTDPDSYKADVSALALEATLTAIKGAGWTIETLKAAYDLIDALNDISTAQVRTEVDAEFTERGASSTRFGYLDNLSAGAIALASVCTELRLAELDATNLPAGIDGIKAATDKQTGTEVAGPYSYLDAGGEQDVYENAVTTRRKVMLVISNRNMTKTGVFRIYRKIDGANYDLWIEQPVTVGAGDERVWDKEFKTNQHWKVTYEEDADEGAARDIPYNVILEAME